MTTRDALMRAILADLDNDAPRLVLADWLDERGEHDEAELIRLQCRIAASDAPLPRETQRAYRALQRLTTPWALPRSAEHGQMTFERGLPAAFELRGAGRSGPAFVRDCLGVQAPCLTHAAVRLSDLDVDHVRDLPDLAHDILAGLAELPALRSLQLAILDGGPIRLAEPLAGCESLERLALIGAQIAPEQLGAIVGDLALEHLSLYSVDTDVAAGVRGATSLRALTIADGELGPWPIVDTLPNLRSLSHRGAPPGPETVDSLVQLPLESLELNAARLDRDALEQLARLPRLKELTLWLDSRGGADLCGLSRAEGLQALTLIEVGPCRATELAWLAELPHLRSLSLWGDWVLPHHLSTVARQASRLRELTLNGCSRLGASALRHLRPLELRGLHLSRCDSLGDDALFAIARQFATLSALSFESGALSPVGVRELANITTLEAVHLETRQPTHRPLAADTLAALGHIEHLVAPDLVWSQPEELISRSRLALLETSLGPEVSLPRGMGPAIRDRWNSSQPCVPFPGLRDYCVPAKR